MIRFRPLLVPTLWFLPAILILIGLGVWQMQRLQWKTDLINTVETHMRAPAEDFASAMAQGVAQAEWRHVRLRGRFLHDKELYFFAQGPNGEPGVQVITPFEQDSGGIVLVNRGFVPDGKKDPATRSQAQIAGETEIAGVLRLSVNPGVFTPAPDTKTRLWFGKDAETMAAALGISLAAPVFVEADATPNPGGYPLGGQTKIDFPNNHLQYAITWFLLAVALGVMYLLYHRSRGRLG